MSIFSQLHLPPQMRPELAQRIAETLCYAPGDSSIVSFMALSLLFASWQSDGPATLGDFAERLRGVYAKRMQLVLDDLTNENLYPSQGNKYGVGQLTTLHAEHAVLLWSKKLNPVNVSRLASMAESIFAAAVSDTSDRAKVLARDIGEAIALDYQGEPDDIERSEHIIIVGPNGPAGPFKSKAAAQNYMMKAMQAHMHGEPMPPLPGQHPPVVVNHPEPELARAPGMRVYSQAEAIDRIQRLPPPMPGEGNMQQRRLLEVMANAEGWRNLTIVPNENPLPEMRNRFPHFSAVVDFVAQRLALAACGSEGSPVRIPPILLRGVPGTGKSYFAKELARALGTYYVERDLSVMTEAFCLTGMDAGWKGSKPGIVFEAVINGKTANPLICLNEIDKASARGAHNSPISSLYTLLEPESSMNFTDEFIPVAIDASRIIWLCTANEGEIPLPILERMEVFDIKEPTKTECRTIAVSVWQSICASVLPSGHGFATELGETLLDAVSAMRPRIMRKTLTHAAGAAAVKGNKFMTLEDLSGSQKRYETVPVRGIGFLP